MHDNPAFLCRENKSTLKAPQWTTREQTVWKDSLINISEIVYCDGNYKSMKNWMGKFHFLYCSFNFQAVHSVTMFNFFLPLTVSRPVFSDYFYHEFRRDREEIKGRWGQVSHGATRIDIENFFQDHDNDIKAPLLEQLCDICTTLCIENKSAIYTNNADFTRRIVREKKWTFTGLLLGLNRDWILSAACDSAVWRLELLQ